MEERAQQAGDAWLEFLNTSGTGNEMGSCFDNCAHFILSKPHFEGSPVVLCQGKVWSKALGYHPHAWLEWGDGVGLVIDPSNGEPTASIFVKPAYLRAGQVKSVRRFSHTEVMVLMAKTRTYGPWRG